MNQSQLIPTQHRRALDVHGALSRKPLVALILGFWLVAALAVVTGSPMAHAEARNQAVAAESVAAPVNINTADAATLAEALRGVGESRAQEIVRHRETYGPFASAEELMEVKGIGQSTLNQNRDLITLE